MRTLSELRALAVQISKTENVHANITENQYGWHVVVRAGQPREDEDGTLVWHDAKAPIMVAATAPTLNAVVQQAYSTLQFEVGE